MSGTIDLDDVRRHGMALANGVEEVLVMGESLEVMLAEDASVRACTQAIAAAGPLLLALAARNEALEAEVAALKASQDKVLSTFSRLP